MRFGPDGAVLRAAFVLIGRRGFVCCVCTDWMSYVLHAVFVLIGYRTFRMRCLRNRVCGTAPLRP